MYELKKEIGKVLTSKSVGTGPSSYEKRLTKVEKHWTNTGYRGENILYLLKCTKGFIFPAKV